jgi:hypothetical protein
MIREHASPNIIKANALIFQALLSHPIPSVMSINGDASPLLVNEVKILCLVLRDSPELPFSRALLESKVRLKVHIWRNEGHKYFVSLSLYLGLELPFLQRSILQVHR